MIFEILVGKLLMHKAAVLAGAAGQGNQNTLIWPISFIASMQAVPMPRRRLEAFLRCPEGADGASPNLVRRALDETQLARHFSP